MIASSGHHGPWCPFFWFCYFSSVWSHLKRACMMFVWADVQTGYDWAGIPVSVHLWQQLILVFVCSIWAKFSNGDNNRGRPGERRRWVLLFSRVSCMLLQASQLHLPSSFAHLPHPCVPSRIHFVFPQTIFISHGVFCLFSHPSKTF